MSSEQVERALAIMGGGWGPDTAERITTCRCGKKVQPQFAAVDGGEGEGVVIFPMCDECKATDHAWLETHCVWCRKDVPRVELEEGQEQLCGDCQYEAKS